MKKSLLALSLAAILLTGLTGCDNADKVSKATTTTIQAEAIAANVRTTFVLNDDGTLYASGANSFGEFGVSTVAIGAEVTTPVVVMTDVEKVTLGEQFTMVLKKDGTLWAAGLNSAGQLGTGDTTNVTVFTQVASDVANVFTGPGSTMIIKKDGTLMATGQNWVGHLGVAAGNTTDQTSFVNVLDSTGATITDATNVSIGQYTTLIVRGTSGNLWRIGDNFFGQCGIGSTGSSVEVATLVSGVSGIEKTALGNGHSLALKTDGTLLVAGGDWVGQLGNGSASSADVLTFTQADTDVEDITASWLGSMYEKTDGTTWYAGDNWHGQAGAGVSGYDSDTDANPLVTFTQSTITGASEIALSQYTGVVLKTDGTVWCAGDNWFGNYGNGESQTKYKVYTQVTTAE